MKTKNYILSIILLLLTISANSKDYDKIVTLKVKSKKFTVIHYHDWSAKSADKRFKMISTTQDPFSRENTYSYIKCIDNRTGTTIFKKPSPAFTKIKISDDEKYIIGISQIILCNPYHLVIYNTLGDLIKKRHISSNEAKLSIKIYNSFRRKFPKQDKYLHERELIYRNKKNIFIDFCSIGMSRRLGNAWYYLYNFATTNHLSEDYSSTVSKIKWYPEEEPEIKFNYQNASLYSVTILDPRKNELEIKINEYEITKKKI